jgi:hypothetical protein
MANSANVRAALRVDVVIDSDASTATGTPVTVLCNRQYNLIDFKFVTPVTSGQADGSLQIESVTPAGVATAIGTVDASLDSGSTTDILRPTTVTLTAGATTGLAAAALVARGNTLRVRSLAAGGDFGANIRASGTIVVLPGNRYAAGNGTYYPNNSSALRA